MRSRIIGFVLLFAVMIGGAWVLQKNFAEKISLQASTDEVASLSTVTVGSKKIVVELAVTSDQKTQGLSGRTSLAKSAGMLFVFKPAEQQAFWMKDMKFALDIVWVANNKIVGVERNVPMPLPGTTTSQLPTYESPAAIDYVLEVNAGVAAELRVGDSFILATNQGA